MEGTDKFKSKYIEKIVDENTSKQQKAKNSIKDYTAINFFDVVTCVGNLTKEELTNMCLDINSGKIKVGMDANAINYIWNNKENENVKYLLKNVNLPMDVDLNSLSELENSNAQDEQLSGNEKFAKIQEMGCKINKVYVNSGEAIAAQKGYDAQKFGTILKNSEAMYNKAVSKLPKEASEEERFMAIYNAVIGKATYDYGALNKNAGERADTSRNLEGFFCENGKSICAGTAEALNQLCKMNGLESRYVEGNSRGVKHAWVRVKIDGKWFNADPTWDACKVAEPYKYCLKNDKEFGKDHKLDQNFSPSYVRNSNGNDVSEIHNGYELNYTDSIDLSVNKYYTEELRNREIYNRDLTEDEIEYLNSSSRADGAYMAQSIGSGTSIFTWILNVLLKISSLPLKASKMAQNFIESKKNKGKGLSKITNSNAEQYVKDEIKETPNAIFADIKLEGEELKKAENYGAKTTEVNTKNQSNIEDEKVK